MGRAYWMTFWGEYRGHGTPHESAGHHRPAGDPGHRRHLLRLHQPPRRLVHRPPSAPPPFEHFVEPTFAFPAVEHPEFTPARGALHRAGGRRHHHRLPVLREEQGAPRPHPPQRPGRLGNTFLENKYYLDTLYTDIIVADTKGPLARAAYWFNQNVLDGIVDGAAAVSKKVSVFVYRDVDQLVVDGVVNGTGLVSEESGQFLRRMQTGKVQQYAAILFAGVVVLAGVLVFVV